jgi:hypothetical protein
MTTMESAVPGQTIFRRLRAVPGTTSGRVIIIMVSLCYLLNMIELIWAVWLRDDPRTCPSVIQEELAQLVVTPDGFCPAGPAETFAAAASMRRGKIWIRLPARGQPSTRTK